MQVIRIEAALVKKAKRPCFPVIPLPIKCDVHTSHLYCDRLLAPGYAVGAVAEQICTRRRYAEAGNAVGVVRNQISGFRHRIPGRRNEQWP